MKKIFIVLGIIVAVLIVGSLLLPSERVYTEAQINEAFDEAVANGQDADDTNPLTDMSVSLEEGRAAITGEWEEGQQLSGEIVVSANGKGLRSQNIQITNIAPIVQELFQNIADAIIQGVLDTVVVRQGNIKEVRIEPGRIVVIY